MVLFFVFLYLLVATIEIEDVRVVIWDVGGHVRRYVYQLRIEINAINVEQVLS